MTGPRVAASTTATSTRSSVAPHSGQAASASQRSAATRALRSPLSTGSPVIVAAVGIGRRRLALVERVPVRVGDALFGQPAAPELVSAAQVVRGEQLVDLPVLALGQ